MRRTFEEWVKFYEKKSGDNYILPQGFELHCLPDRGFAQYAIKGRLMWVYQTCGDGHFWNDVAELIAKQAGCTHVVTVLCRPPRPYIRAFGWAIEKEEEHGPDKYLRFYCRDKSDRQVVISQRYYDENGEPIYYVSREV